MAEDLKKRQQIDLGTDEMISIYSNNVSLSGSQWDIRIRFGQIEEADKDKIAIRHLVNVFMSPAHAKVFSDLLAKKVADYERMFPTWQHGVKLSAVTEEDDIETESAK